MFVVLDFVVERFAKLAFVEEIFVISAVLKLAVKNDALFPDRLYIHALVDKNGVQYNIAHDIFVILAFDDEIFVIKAVLNLAIKNGASLPDKLYTHALVDESVV